VYAQLREEAPVYWCEKWNSWLVTRNDDSREVVRDTQVFSNTGRHTVLLQQIEGSARGRLQALQKHFEGRGLINSDPPSHTRLRKLANKAFTPGMVEAMRPRVEAIVDMLLDQVDPTKPFDIIGALAFPLPTIVIAEMLGAPSEDREKFKHWSETITAFSQSGKIIVERAYVAQESIIELTAYFRDLIHQRRVSPKDDLLSALAAASEDGEGLSDDELFDTCVTLLIAGHETTTSLIGNGMFELLQNPDQLEALRANQGLMRSAVEEMLRYHSPVLAVHRRVIKDITLRGEQISEGDLLYMVLASANRDPAVFSEPDRFNIQRPVAENKHVAFGYGLHFCLGAPLARMEAPIALNGLMKRFPNLRMDGEPHWKSNMMVRFLEHLPVRG
ncbi:MAG: cytochrome P450, partial [Chthoniobacterales bacterium]